MKSKFLLFFCVVLSLFSCANIFAETVVNVSFDFNRTSTIASNQTALWIENEEGKVVKTLYVSAFTAKSRGYRRREDSLNRWVYVANPDSLSNAQIDAISSATLRTGSQAFIWDLTDSNGKKVPEGKYFVKLEGTLYWKSNVLYSVQVDLADGDLRLGQVQETRSEKANSQNENMISNVKITKRSR